MFACKPRCPNRAPAHFISKNKATITYPLYREREANVSKKAQIYHKKHIFCGAVSHKARPLQIENELRVGIKVDA